MPQVRAAQLLPLLGLAVTPAAARAASTATDHERFLEAFGLLGSTLERVKPDGTPQCGDSVKLRDRTWEEAKLPLSLIPLVKAMGMEPDCPTAVAAVAGMSHDKKKGRGEVICAFTRSELREFVHASPMLQMHLASYEPPDFMSYFYDICPSTCSKDYGVGPCVEAEAGTKEEKEEPGVQMTSQDLRQLYRNIDRDRDGGVTKKELKMIMTKMGMGGTSMKTFTQFLAALDADDDGLITEEEFLALGSTLIPAPPSHFHDGAEGTEGRFREAARKGIVPLQPRTCTAGDKVFAKQPRSCAAWDEEKNSKDKVELRGGKVPCPFSSMGKPMDFAACDVWRARTAGFATWHREKDIQNADPDAPAPVECQVKSAPLTTPNSVTVVLWLGEWIKDTDGGIASRTPNPASVGHASMLLGPPSTCDAAADEGEAAGEGEADASTAASSAFPRHALLDWETTAAHFIEDTEDAVSKTLQHYQQYISWWPHELVRTQGIQSMTETYPPEAYHWVDDLEAEQRIPSWMLVISGWNDEAMAAMREGWARKLEMLTKGYAGMDSDEGFHGKPRLNTCDAPGDAVLDRPPHRGFHGMADDGYCSTDEQRGDLNELYHILSNSCCHPVIAALRVGVMHLTPPARKEHVLRELLTDPQTSQPYAEGDDEANALSLSRWPLESTLDNPEYSKTATLAMQTAQIAASQPPPDGESIDATPAIMPENVRIASIKLQLALDSYERELSGGDASATGATAALAPAERVQGVGNAEEGLVSELSEMDAMLQGEEKKRQKRASRAARRAADVPRSRKLAILRRARKAPPSEAPPSEGGPSEAAMRQLFRTLDVNDDKMVTKHELRRAIRGWGVKGAERLLATLDRDGDGLVSEDELIALASLASLGATSDAATSVRPPASTARRRTRKPRKRSHAAPRAVEEPTRSTWPFYTSGAWAWPSYNPFVLPTPRRSSSRDESAPSDHSKASSLHPFGNSFVMPFV